MLKARIALAAALALLLSMAAGSAHAQTSATTNFTLQPGGSATITFEAFCTNFGQKFPTSIQAPNGQAPDNLRGGLAYIQSNNLAGDPTTALDATIQAQILDLLRGLQAELGMAVILITHDLGVVAEVAHRVMVMYAGRVVETAPAEAMFQHPFHPYTEGLLASIPRLEGPIERLDAIPGQVPPPEAMPAGCRFAPRCRYVVDACRAASPPLAPRGPSRAAACIRVPA